MIRGFQARGFKVLEATEISFARFTICTGAAGTGKSTLLEALTALGEGATCVVESTSAYLHSGNMGLLRGKRSLGVTDPIVLAVELEQGEVRGELKVFEDGTGGKVTKSDASLQLVCAPLSLDTRAVAEPAGDVPAPSIEPDGRGLAGVLAVLAERRSPLLDDIDRDVRRIVPWVARISTARTAGKSGLARTIVVESDAGETFDLAVAGDGLRVALSLSTFVRTVKAGRTLLVEDLGRGLEPDAARALVEVLQGAIDARPDLQIIATTTSPAIAESVDPKNVRRLTLDARRRTIVATGRGSVGKSRRA